MRGSLRDRCIVGFWLVSIGLATAGWLAGLTWAAIWLTERALLQRVLRNFHCQAGYHSDKARSISKTARTPSSFARLGILTVTELAMRRFHGTEPAHSGYFLCAAKTAQSRQHCPAKLSGLPETPALVGTPLGPGALPGPFYAERASARKIIVRAPLERRC